MPQIEFVETAGVSTYNFPIGAGVFFNIHKLYQNSINGMGTLF